MSGPVTLNNSLQRVMEWKKRSNYFRLESESSIASEGTESIDSIQDRETDVVRDTSDTDSDIKEYSGSELELEVEYEMRSLSEGDDYLDAISSSGTEILEAAETAIAAVLCDSSLEAWATDGEMSSNSSSDDFEFGVANSQHSQHWTCVQCKSLNTNPIFRYCNKCFQVKKTFFPPRPRGNRKRKLEKEQNKPKVKLDTLQSCLSGLKSYSQDSGLGSSQELPQLDFNKIIVPEHLKQKHSISESTSQVNNNSDSDLFDEPPTKSRKLTVEDERSSKSLSDHSDEPPSNSQSLEDEQSVQPSDLVDEQPSDQKLSENMLDTPHNKVSSELCMMCNSNPKNGIFLHGSIGHTCCCYKCAMKSWKTSKRCPICNCKVKNVIKLYTL